MPQVNKVPHQAIFYWALAPLVAFYALFAAILLPNVGWLHPVDQVATWSAALPDSLSCFVKVSWHSHNRLMPSFGTATPDLLQLQ